jgi:hypothetical protein
MLAAAVPAGGQRAVTAAVGQRHCHASTCASRPRLPTPSHQASGHRVGQPMTRLLVGFGPRPTSARTCWAWRRGGPGASAARRRRSARRTATPRSRGRAPSARRPPRSLPGWRRCLLPAASALRSPQLAQPPQVTAGGAAVVRALASVLNAPNEQITVLERQVDTHFSPHPDAEIILSRTGTGTRTRPPVTSSGSRPTTARTRGPAG